MTSLCIKFRIMRILQGQRGIAHRPPFFRVAVLIPRNRQCQAAQLRLDDFWAQHLATGFYSMAIYRQAARARGQPISRSLRVGLHHQKLPLRRKGMIFFILEALLLQIPLQLLVLCS